MNTNELEKVWNILKDMETDELEDRREYDVADLARMYDLSGTAANEMHIHIRQNFQTDVVSVYNSQPVGDIEEVLTESMHGSYDGWPDWKKLVIDEYLHDVGKAVYYQRELQAKLDADKK